MILRFFKEGKTRLHQIDSFSDDGDRIEWTYDGNFSGRVLLKDITKAKVFPDNYSFVIWNGPDDG